MTRIHVTWGLVGNTTFFVDVSDECLAIIFGNTDGERSHFGQEGHDEIQDSSSSKRQVEMLKASIWRARFPIETEPLLSEAFEAESDESPILRLLCSWINLVPEFNQAVSSVDGVAVDASNQVRVVLTLPEHPFYDAILACVVPPRTRSEFPSIRVRSVLDLCQLLKACCPNLHPEPIPQADLKIELCRREFYILHHGEVDDFRGCPITFLHIALHEERRHFDFIMLLVGLGLIHHAGNDRQVVDVNFIPGRGRVGYNARHCLASASTSRTDEDVDFAEKTIMLLVDQFGANVNEVSDRYKVSDRYTDSVTPLHLAAKNANLPVARILVERNANVDASNHAGLTPLLLACRYGHLELVKFLAEEQNAKLEGALEEALAQDGGHDDLSLPVAHWLVDDFADRLAERQEKMASQGVEDEFMVADLSLSANASSNGIDSHAELEKKRSRSNRGLAYLARLRPIGSDEAKCLFARVLENVEDFGPTHFEIQGTLAESVLLDLDFDGADDDDSDSSSVDSTGSTCGGARRVRGLKKYGLFHSFTIGTIEPYLIAFQSVSFLVMRGASIWECAEEDTRPSPLMFVMQKRCAPLLRLMLSLELRRRREPRNIGNIEADQALTWQDVLRLAREHVREQLASSQSSEGPAMC
eukprot:TRINITY_DN54290_c0_g1_i1.p1 TRINITY_DN54290_c0_g1~~TRINITY_DN54290_c0_g1_i1.p1  ORF type:complete len:662 (-),score=59.76 TRINITY_DN54290_c0_g1_i1:73-2001(-)